MNTAVRLYVNFLATCGHCISIRGHRGKLVHFSSNRVDGSGTLVHSLLRMSITANYQTVSQHYLTSTLTVFHCHFDVK